MLLCARSSTRVSRNEKNRYLTLVTLNKMGLWAKFEFIVLPQWQILKETGVFQSTIAFTTTITRPRIEKNFPLLWTHVVSRDAIFPNGSHSNLIFGAQPSARSALFIFPPSLYLSALFAQTLVSLGFFLHNLGFLSINYPNSGFMCIFS